MTSATALAADDTHALVIEIVADLVCPWCYLGLRRLERALAMRPGLRPRIAWRPFLLNPDAPLEGVPLQAYLAAATGGDPGRVVAGVLKAAADDPDLFDFAAIDVMPNSLDAHRLVRWAGRRDIGDDTVQRRLVSLLFRAYFGFGRNIARHQVLAALAAEVGLDARAAALFLAGDEHRLDVLRDHQQVRNLGIKGVPCFILDSRYALSGAQEPEVFLPLLDLAGTTV
jgi:predicted DsbA family dithiol-disulfide isomerase